MLFGTCLYNHMVECPPKQYQQTDQPTLGNINSELAAVSLDVL